jgi:dienelactone hydrolase
VTSDLSATDEVKENTLSGLRPVRVTTYSISAILLAVGLALAFSWGFRMVRAATLMYGMSYTNPPLIIRAYSRAFRHPIVTTDQWIQGRGRPLELRVMAPKDLPNAPIIVLVHGFASNGIRNGLLNSFAQSLSQSGLKVVMPDIKSEKMLRIDRAAVADVDDAIRWSAIGSGQKVSVFGISFSGGMVITAVANPEYTDYVKMTFCVSGYNSIERLGRYYLHDDVMGPDGKRYSGTPIQNALTPMALQYSDELVPPNEIEPLSDAMRTMADQMGFSGSSPTASLTSNQRVLLNDLINVRTPGMRARYHALLDRHRAELADISPMGKIPEVRGSLFVLHGYADETIPVGEAEWTRAEGIHLSNVKVLLTSWVNHCVLVPRASFQDKLQVVHFVSEMLDEALHPVPLPPANSRVEIKGFSR